MTKPTLIARRIIGTVLAAALCAGTVQPAAVDVQAANYQVHTSNNLVKTANETESDDAALIVNTREFSVTVNNKEFTLMNSSVEKTRKMVLLERSKVPVKEDESKTWKDICTLTYRNAGYLPDGKLVDVTYMLDSLTLSGTVKNDYNDEAAYLEVASGTVNGAVSSSHWCNGQIEEILARAPYGTDYHWTVKVTASDGSRINSIKMPLLFKDIDILSHNSSEQEQSEGITLVSGFANDTWTQRGSRLKVTNGGASYDGTGESETNDPLNAVLTIADSTTIKLDWRGQTARTYIMPLSGTGTYATIDKKVDKSEAELGDTITYTIPVTFGLTNEVNEKKSAKVYDDLNEILEIKTAQMHVEKDGADVTSEWDIAAKGQRVDFVAKNPAKAQGDYSFIISASITKDAKLVDRLIREGKVTRRAVSGGNEELEFSNIANLEFDDASGHSVKVDTDVPVTVNVPSRPEIMLEKKTEITELRNGKAGDVIPYTFTIMNTGKVTLYDVNIQDALAVTDFKYDWKSCASKTNEMLPGESAHATAKYTLTQADIDAGNILNTATVYGTDIQGIIVDDTDDAGTVLASEPKIQIIKNVDKTMLKNANAGDELSYTFAVTNTGKVTLSNLVFGDSRELEGLSWDGSLDSLAVGGVLKGSAVLHITQDDIDAGQIINSADITGTAPDGTTVTDKDDAKTAIVSEPGIRLVKTTDPLILNTENSVAGHIVPYTFTVSNIGHNTLHDIHIEDQLDGVSEVIFDWSTASMGSEGTLLPGESVDAHAFYALTQEDVDNEQILNTATVYGTDPFDKKVDATDDVTVKLAGQDNARIELEKEIEFAKIRNEKGQQFMSFVMTGAMLGAAENAGETADAGADAETGDAAVTGAEDITEEAATEAEEAAAAGTEAVTEENADTEAEEAEENPGTAFGEGMENEAAPETAGQEFSVGSDGSIPAGVKPGFVVPFRFKITNTGHKTLYNVTITDELKGISAIRYDWSTAASGTDTMLPGETAFAYATYPLTQADIDAGRIDNYAVVTGKPKIGIPVTDDSEVGTKIPQNPEIKIVKDTAVKEIRDAVAGETVIPYTFTMTNTGNNTLHDVTFTDDHEVEGIVWDKELSVLEPGESVKGSANYTVKQEDIANGSVLNTAFVTAVDPEGTPVKDDDDTTTKIEQHASLTLTKTVDKKKIANAKAGDLITYEITSTNDGNLTVNKIVFEDSLSGKGLSELEYTWPGKAGTLLPGETVKVKATYEVQQADIDAGIVANSVSVTGIPDIPNDPDPDPVTPPEQEVITELEQTPGIKVTKTADASEVRDAKAGDEIHYTMVGENTGNVTLNNVKLTDKLDGVKDMKLKWDKEEGTLDPGEKVTATAAYALTADDIARGKVENVVIITGETPDPDSPPPTDEDKADSLIPSITTVATDAADGDKTVIAATASAIRDKISFKDFATKSLTVVSSVYDRNTKEAVKVNGKEVSVTRSVALKESSGEAEVEISFNATGLGGKTLGIVTKVYESGTDKLICQHNADLSDDSEAVAMTPDAKTTITGEKKTTPTPKTAAGTTRTISSGNPSSSSPYSSAPTTRTAESVKTGDDNTARNAVIVLVAGLLIAALCLHYLRKRMSSK